MTTPEPPDDADADDLAAYLDGELDPADADTVAARLAHDPHERARADGLRKTFDLLDVLSTPALAADFTARTLTRIDAHPGASRPTVAASVVMPTPAPRRRGVWVLLASLAALIGVLGGFAARRVAGVRADPPPDLAADYRVSVRLPWYRGVDDLATVRALADSGLFPPDDGPPPAILTAPSTPADKLIGVFQALAAARQRQLRRLDAEFVALPAADQDRLAHTLDSYAVWLDRLPAEDRAQILGAPASERLGVVRVLRAAAPTDRHLLWGDAAAWDQLAGRPWPFTDPALAAAVDGFVRDVLKADLSAVPDPKLDAADLGRLSRDEYVDLRARRADADRSGAWGVYGLEVHRLARRHPSLPEPAAGKPVTDAKGLPNDFVRALRGKGVTPRLDMTGRGKWPEFALDVAAEAKKVNVVVPSSLGPCRPGELPPAVRATLDKFPAADRAALTKLEGKWPDYPRELVRLATAADLPVPGVTLPGPPSRWARVYGRE